jgi:HD-GYP domain-containing protein (c-di-GMP phosphodiesterase class II)
VVDFRDLENSPIEKKNSENQEKQKVSFSEAVSEIDRKLSSGAVENEVSTALYESACAYIDNVFAAVRKKSDFPLEHGFQLVRKMVEIQPSNDSLFVLALHRDNPDNFLINHSVNTAIFAIKMGAGLGYDNERQAEIGIAALLHDIGSAKIPQGILNKMGTLSHDDLNIIRKRPEYSRSILKSNQDSPAFLADIALQVYEKTDGSGYPQGLKAEEIHAYAQIIGLVDIYEALIHTRPWREKFLHFSAIKEILKEFRNTFERNYLKALLAEFSIFPLYSYVQLNSEAIGRVIETYPDHPMRPRLNIVYDSQKKKVMTERMVNLPENPLLYIVDSVSEQLLAEMSDR